MGKGPSGPMVTKILYCAIAYYVFLYYCMIYTVVDSMWHFHVKIHTFKGRHIGNYPLGPNSNQSNILQYNLLYNSLLQFSVCCCRLYVAISCANLHFWRQIYGQLSLPGSYYPEYYKVIQLTICSYTMVYCKLLQTESRNFMYKSSFRGQICGQFFPPWALITMSSVTI